MFPRGFHPIANLWLPDNINAYAPIVPRHSVPITYYFVDFGISTLFAKDDTDRLVTGIDGLDDEVPELSDDVPYDPFMVDIFVLGNMFRRQCLEVRLRCDLVLQPRLRLSTEVFQRRYARASGAEDDQS